MSSRKRAWPAISAEGARWDWSKGWDAAPWTPCGGDASRGLRRVLPQPAHPIGRGIAGPDRRGQSGPPGPASTRRRHTGIATAGGLAGRRPGREGHPGSTADPRRSTRPPAQPRDGCSRPWPPPGAARTRPQAGILPRPSNRLRPGGMANPWDGQALAIGTGRYGPGTIRWRLPAGRPQVDHRPRPAIPGIQSLQSSRPGADPQVGFAGVASRDGAGITMVPGRGPYDAADGRSPDNAGTGTSRTRSQSPFCQRPWIEAVSRSSFERLSREAIRRPTEAGVPTAGREQMREDR